MGEVCISVEARLLPKSSWARKKRAPSPIDDTEPHGAEFVGWVAIQPALLNSCLLLDHILQLHEKIVSIAQETDTIVLSVQIVELQCEAKRIADD